MVLSKAAWKDEMRVVMKVEKMDATMAEKKDMKVLRMVVMKAEKKDLIKAEKKVLMKAEKKVLMKAERKVLTMADFCGFVRGLGLNLRCDHSMRNSWLCLGPSGLTGHDVNRDNVLRRCCRSACQPCTVLGQGPRGELHRFICRRRHHGNALFWGAGSFRHSMKFQKMSDRISVCSRLDCIFKNTKNIIKCCFYCFK